MLLKFLCLFIAVSLGSGFQLAELKCWNKKNDSHYLGLGLTISENIDDTMECINKCRGLSHCHVVDIDENSRPKCWYQQKTFTALKTDVLPKAGCTNYFYSPKCAELTEGVDLNCWTVSIDSRIFGLTKFDRRTLKECLDTCIGKDICHTVDWNTLTSPNCWLQTGPMDVSPRKLWWTLVGTNFMLNRECLKLINETIPTDEKAYWKVTEMAQYGAEWLTQIDLYSLRECLEFCKKNQYCYMVDYNPASKTPCYVQTNPFVIKRGNLVWSKTGYNFLFLREEYRKKYPAFSVEQQPYCWFYLNDTNYHGSGLQSVSTARNLDSCLTPCYSNPSCKAAIYDVNSGNPCQHVISNKGLEDDKYFDQKDVTLYVPDVGCTQDKLGK